MAPMKSNSSVKLFQVMSNTCCHLSTHLPPPPLNVPPALIIRTPVAHLSPTNGGRNLFRMTDSLADKTFAFAPTGSRDAPPLGLFGLQRRAVSEGRSGRGSSSRSGGGSGTVGLGYCSSGGSGALTSASSDGYLLRHVSMPSAGDIGEWYVWHFTNTGTRGSIYGSWLYSSTSVCL